MHTRDLTATVMAWCLTLLTPPSGASAAVDRTIRDRGDALARASGADAAVAFRTLDGRDSLFLRNTDTFHAAST